LSFSWPVVYIVGMYLIVTLEWLVRILESRDETRL
jgi:hypothetical protein